MRASVLNVWRGRHQVIAGLDPCGRDRSSHGSEVHAAIERPLSPVLQAVAVRYPV